MNQSHFKWARIISSLENSDSSHDDSLQLWYTDVINSTVRWGYYIIWVISNELKSFPVWKIVTRVMMTRYTDTVNSRWGYYIRHCLSCRMNSVPGYWGRHSPYFLPRSANVTVFRVAETGWLESLNSQSFQMSSSKFKWERVISNQLESFPVLKIE